ncbi:MAG: O-antigen ligase family protein [Clostridiaceae bacterium]|nr:O-antigen ligase family protein [Clostridiaceae bacterium]
MIFMYKKSTPISNGFTVEIVLWIAFAISSFFIGYVIITNKSHLISAIIPLIENLILIIFICFISKYDGNIDYMVKIFIILAFLCAITTIFWGEGFQGSNRISMTSTTNPNGLGVLLVTGIFCLLYKMDIDKKINIIFTSSGALIFLYTIILTGSRKSFLAASLLLVYWVLLCLRGTLKKATFSRKTGVIILVSVAAISFIYYITPVFEESVMLYRLTNLFESGDTIRTGMYTEAYDFFISSPLYGIGYKNYELLSVYRTYSHSTYAEALACTGLLGVFLYFSAYIIMAVKTIRVIINKHLSHNVRIQARNILGIFLVMLFLGTGVIHFYEINSSIVFAMIISFNKLYYKSRKLVLF